MHHDIEFAPLSLQGVRQMVNIGLLLHLAREERGRADFAAQFLYGRFCAFILIGQKQLRALARECLRDGVRDAPFVPYTEDDCGFAFE
jgi:hypothetical protein